ncbi:MAG TPA: mycothiol system anti-sigma-R factor [Acidimicrobiales bacterium]|nr:mycothiol system anti-sigma-R factor [Acidimicrobiales bacterium]
MTGEDSWSGLDCRETVHRLYHYLDGELTSEKRGEIARHLDECSPCLRAFDFEGEIRHLIASCCKDHVPDHLRERIAAAIDHEHRSRSGATGDPPAASG